MPQTAKLPALHPTIPEDISAQLRRLLLTPNDPALKTWLLELIKNSGHLSNTDDLRWRLLCVVWLAQFDVDEAWPYLMWLNMNEPVMQDHLNELLIDAANDFDCHVLLANWVANAQDERLSSFFSGFFCFTLGSCFSFSLFLPFQTSYALLRQAFSFGSLMLRTLFAGQFPFGIIKILH